MKKTLVACFSASNVTKAVAQTLAEAENADFYEIVPETPYTEADLDWRNEKSRSTVEMQDPSCRPAIKGSVENMDQYEVVFIGFPIWWGREPSIVDTFLEAYDFSGKTIIPFCTSGGSGVGRSDTALHKNVSGNVKWAEGVQINRPDEAAIKRMLEQVL